MIFSVSKVFTHQELLIFSHLLLNVTVLLNKLLLHSMYFSSNYLAGKAYAVEGSVSKHPPSNNYLKYKIYLFFYIFKFKIYLFILKDVPVGDSQRPTIQLLLVAPVLYISDLYILRASASSSTVLTSHLVWFLFWYYPIDTPFKG